LIAIPRPDGIFFSVKKFALFFFTDNKKENDRKDLGGIYFIKKIIVGI
jgi:hypothetical protein